MLTATSVLRSLQRISRAALPSGEASAAETRGLSSRGDFSSLTTQPVSASGLLSLWPRGAVEAVVAFEPLRIVLELTASSESILGLSAGGEQKAGVRGNQNGAHFLVQGLIQSEPTTLD